jgi:hypothetical protein
MNMPRTDDIYVGYRDVPAQIRRSLLVLVPGLLCTLAVLAIGIAAAQRSPGKGIWSQSTTTLSGTLIAQPLPALLHTTPTGESQLTLLVEEGKHGAQPRVTPLHGLHITLTGTTLSRGSTTMLEIASLTASTTHPDTLPQLVWQGSSTTLVGEVVDAKCYLGAMKPGDGKSHKACATLCVTNGIPAMPVTADSAYVIAAGWQPDHAKLIAEPVEVSTTVGQWGTLPVIDVHTITRRGVFSHASKASAFAQ